MLLIAKLSVIYLLLCIAIGLLGRNRKLGAWGHFLGALILGPVLGLLALMVTAP